MRSFVRLSSIIPGFRAEGLLTGRVQASSRATILLSDRPGFFSNALTRIGTLPGVQSAAGVAILPMAGGGIGTSFWRTDQPAPAPGQAPSTDVRPVTPSFFRTMGIPHVMGRDFDVSDRDESPLLWRSSTRRWSGDIYRKRSTPSESDYTSTSAAPIARLRDRRRRRGYQARVARGRGASHGLYFPTRSSHWALMTFVVRTEMNPMSLAKSVAAESVRSTARSGSDVRTMDDVVASTLARPRVVAVLLTAFAVMALASRRLACTG